MRDAYGQLAGIAANRSNLSSREAQREEVFDYIADLARELSVMATLNGDAFLGGLLDIAAKKADSLTR